MKFRYFFFILTIISANISAKNSCIVFPFVNETSDSLYTWASTAFSDLLFRKISHNNQMQIWEPIFLFQVDSTAYKMNSDSIMSISHNRWQWDVAIGGSYRIVNDSIFVTMNCMLITEKERVKRQFSSKCKMLEIEDVCANLILQAYPFFRVEVSKDDSAAALKKLDADPIAYRTYCSGLFSEMHSNISAALTSYTRASEIDPRFGLSLCREANIYRLGGDYALARSLFDKACSAFPMDNYVVCSAGDYYVDCALPVESMRFIEERHAFFMNSSSGLKVLGKMNIVSGEYQRAISLLTRSVAAAPSDLDAQFSLGTAYLQSGEFSTAIDLFNQLIKYRPNYMRYYSALGSAYRRSGKLMESVMVLEAALKVEPDNITILNDCAHTYFALKWFDKSAQLLEHARELFPGSGNILINLGVVYWHQNKVADAEKIFAAASKIPVTRQSAWNNIANLFFLEGNTNKAIGAYEKADRSGSKNETVLYNTGHAFLSKNNLKKAVHYFDEVLRLSPGRLDVLVLQASLANRLNKTSDAELYYRKILDITPYHEDAIHGLVRIFIQQKRFEEALKPIEVYLSHLPNNKEFLILQALVFQKMEWYEVAIMKYQNIQKDYPKEAAIYKGIGECMYNLIKYKGSRQYDSAIDNLKLAITLDPIDPVPDKIAGDIYIEYKGDRDLALEHWNKALSKSHDNLARKEIRARIQSAR